MTVKEIVGFKALSLGTYVDLPLWIGPSVALFIL